MTLGNDDPMKKGADAPPDESATIPAQTSDAGAPGGPDDADQVFEILRDGDDGSGEASPVAEEPVQKRTRRTSRRELLGLLQRKNTTLAELDKELKKVKEELKGKEDRYLRLAAEFENYRKRIRREWELHQKQANADLIREIVGGMDNFDRAFASLGEADVQLTEGLRMIFGGLMDILRKTGLTEIDALHQKFDPTVHEAIGEVDANDIEEGYVAQVVQRGYRLHDAVLRPARVLVSRKSEQTGPS